MSGEKKKKLPKAKKGCLLHFLEDFKEKGESNYALPF
jgi:hypothetical protein